MIMWSWKEWLFDAKNSDIFQILWMTRVFYQCLTRTIKIKWFVNNKVVNQQLLIRQTYLFKCGLLSGWFCWCFYTGNGMNVFVTSLSGLQMLVAILVTATTTLHIWLLSVLYFDRNKCWVSQSVSLLLILRRHQSWTICAYTHNDSSFGLYSILIAIWTWTLLLVGPTFQSLNSIRDDLNIGWLMSFIITNIMTDMWFQRNNHFGFFGTYLPPPPD